MRYLLPDTATANHYGFSTFTHTTSGERLILNEKEVMASTLLKGDIEKRAETLGCTVLTRTELKNIINSNHK